jgi:hypothetical protein
VGFTCRSCGRHHEEELRDVRAGLPEEIFRLSQAERASRATGLDAGSDVACLDGTRFFVRAVVRVPILGEGDSFGWGVWVRVEESLTGAIAAAWDDPSAEGQMFPGLLATDLTEYGGTLDLTGRLTMRTVDLLPDFELAELRHPFALDQRHGIALDRARELADPYRSEL